MFAIILGSKPVFLLPVPTAYPLDVYSRLCMVDNLERLGIARHFREEIISILDDTYRSQSEYWLFLNLLEFSSLNCLKLDLFSDE